MTIQSLLIGKKSAVQYAPAQYYIGWCYDYGNEVKRDVKTGGILVLKGRSKQ